MKFSNSPRILISSAMRSGSSLISNILNAHSKIQIIENFHFYRFIYQNGEPLTDKIVKFKIEEMDLSLDTI